MRSLVILFIFSVSVVFSQTDTIPLVNSAGSSAIFSEDVKQASLPRVLAREALVGISSGFVATMLGLGLYAIVDKTIGTDSGTLDGLTASCYLGYIIGIGVGTNLSMKTDGYNPPLWGSIAVSVGTGVICYAGLSNSRSKAITLLNTYPLYVPLISSIVFNHLASYQQPHTNGKKSIVLFPGVNKSGGTINMHLAL